MDDILIKNINEIFNYDDWANQKLMTNIKKISDEDYEKPISMPFSHIHGLLQHLYHYQEKYFQKIVNISWHKITEPQLSRNELSENILRCSKEWLNWAKNLENEVNIGLLFQDVIYLFAHNNYHRGQLQIALAYLGLQPESIDIFLYKDLRNDQ